MSKYIVTQEPKEMFDCNGKSLGMSEKLAVFYSKKIGKRRHYRQSMANPSKGMELLTFKKEDTAREEADYINDIFGQEFRVEQIKE